MIEAFGFTILGFVSRPLFDSDRSYAGFIFFNKRSNLGFEIYEVCTFGIFRRSHRVGKKLCVF